MMKRLRFILGALLGAATMYFLDPGAGRRRRALMRDRFVKARHTAVDTASGKMEYAKDKAYGSFAEARSSLSEDVVDDHRLEDRVRSSLGHITPYTGSIQVSAYNGRVTLEGTVPQEDMSRVAGAVESVRGVKEVDNRLHTQEQMAGGS